MFTLLNFVEMADKLLETGHLLTRRFLEDYMKLYLHNRGLVIQVVIIPPLLLLILLLLLLLVLLHYHHHHVRAWSPSLLRASPVQGCAACGTSVPADERASKN